MSRPSKDSHKLTKTVPLRISDAMWAEAEYAGGRLEEENAVGMRLAMRIGYAHLRRCDYKVAEAILDKVRGTRGKIRRKNA